MTVSTYSLDIWFALSFGCSLLAPYLLVSYGYTKLLMYVRLVSLPRLRGVGLASVAIFIVTVVYICFAPASIREQGMSSGPLSQHGRCTDKHEIVRTQSWQEIDAKFNNLTDEKFTYVIRANCAFL